MDGVAGQMKRLEISVNRQTHDPDSVWERYQRHDGRKCVPFEPLPLDTPIDPSKVRFVCLSDTHSSLHKVDVPPGDVLLHAGDFTFMGKDTEIHKFNESIEKLPHRHKIVIAGNHELSFKPPRWGNRYHVAERMEKKHKVRDPRALLTNCVYLEDTEIEVFGYRIYGSPWQPEHMGWAFNLPRGEPLLEKWNLIPEGIDVLITHGPPLGHGDYARCGEHVGCVELLDTVEKRVKPKYHIFGHIHEGYGCTTNGETVFVNASVCTVSYRPKNKPVIFDLPLRDGQSKL